MIAGRKGKAIILPTTHRNGTTNELLLIQASHRKRIHPDFRQSAIQCRLGTGSTTIARITAVIERVTHKDHIVLSTTGSRFVIGIGAPRQPCTP
ncbi:hypothetical protein D3C78_1039190 [compost metagenome]